MLCIALLFTFYVKYVLINKILFMAKIKKTSGSGKKTNHEENQVTGSRQNLKVKEHSGGRSRSRQRPDYRNTSGGYSGH